METIRFAGWINAPVERCFRLSLSADLHLASAQSHHEKAIKGVTSGLLGQGDVITFRSRHFGVPHTHTIRIELLRPCNYIRAVIDSGAFLHLEHDHYFASMDDGTRVRNEIRFSLRRSLLRPFAKFFVRKQLLAMLRERHALLKSVAESEEWHQYLDGRQGITTTLAVDNRMSGNWEKRSPLQHSRFIL